LIKKIQKKWFILLFAILAVFFVNICYKYNEYKNFISKYQFVKAKIVNQYKKQNHWVLKIKNNTLTFYTTTKDDLKDILNQNIEVGVVTKKISFWGFLTSFYAPTYHLGVLDKPKYKSFVQEQHKNKYIQNLFCALFFGDSLYHKTRIQLANLGISYLLALSGLHLAILSGFLYFLFAPIYSFFVKPYRNKNIDLGILILIVLFCYLWFVGFPPSLVRSFVMEVLAFLFAFSLRNVVSFELLFFSALMCIALFPSFIISIGFFLSVSGVFLIFLFFKYFKATWLNGVIVLPIYLFFSMFLISHYFFGNFSIYQFLSPFISIVFTIFYPLEILLHLVGYGDIMDKVIEFYLNLGNSGENIYTPKIVFYIYIFVLLLVAFWGDNLLKFVKSKFFNIQKQ
jgi:competence protein ComEC